MTTIRMVQTHSHGSRVVEMIQTIPTRLGSQAVARILARCHARPVMSNPGHLNQWTARSVTSNQACLHIQKTAHSVTSNLISPHSQKNAHSATSSLISPHSQRAVVTFVTNSPRLIRLSETLAEELVETSTTSHKDRVRT